MEVNPSDITILVPVHNTDFKCFNKHVKSIEKHFEYKKIYWDDGITDEHILYILYNKVAKFPNTKIYKNNKNLGLEKTVYKMSQKVNTKYIVRVDSDDEYHSFPNYKKEQEDFDILLTHTAPKNLALMFENGRSFNGSIIKTDIFKNVVKDFHNFDKLNMTDWMHEDVWYQFSILVPLYLNKSNLKLYVSKDKIYRPKRCLHSKQITIGKVTRPIDKRWDTFLLWCMHRKDFETYYKISVEFRGVSPAIVKRAKEHGIHNRKNQVKIIMNKKDKT